MRSITIEIEYPGCVITVGHYKHRGGIYTKQEAKNWMEQFGWAIKEKQMFQPDDIRDWRQPLSVRCSGRFKDQRATPDLSNLSKLILDELEEITGVNDKYMHWHDGDVTHCKEGEEPVLVITISENEG